MVGLPSDGWSTAQAIHARGGSGGISVPRESFAVLPVTPGGSGSVSRSGCPKHGQQVASVLPSTHVVPSACTSCTMSRVALAQTGWGMKVILAEHLVARHGPGTCPTLRNPGSYAKHRVAAPSHGAIFGSIRCCGSTGSPPRAQSRGSYRCRTGS